MAAMTDYLFLSRLRPQGFYRLEKEAIKRMQFQPSVMSASLEAAERAPPECLGGAPGPAQATLWTPTDAPQQAAFSLSLFWDGPLYKQINTNPVLSSNKLLIPTPSLNPHTLC